MVIGVFSEGIRLETIFLDLSLLKVQSFDTPSSGECLC